MTTARIPGELRVERLSKAFGGVHAIENLTFAVQPGTVHSIIGPNGAGKTTLINLLTGVYRPTAGRILYEGVAPREAVGTLMRRQLGPEHD